MRLVQFLDFQLMKEDQILTFYFFKIVKDFFVVGGVEMSMNYVSSFNCRNHWIYGSSFILIFLVLKGSELKWGIYKNYGV